MYWYGNTLVLLALKFFLAGRASDQESTSPTEEPPWVGTIFKIHNENKPSLWWDMIRDIAVPAECWDTRPWALTDPDPYIRDRFLLHWAHRVVPDNTKFYICESRMLMLPGWV